MKSNFIVSMVIAIALSSVSFAQFSNSNTSTYKPETAAEGLKLSLLLPMLTAKTKISANNPITGESISASDSEGIDTIGIGIGYANVPVNSVGFVGQVSFLTIDGDEGSENTDTLRFDANAAYSVHEMAYVKGGVNFATFTSDNAKDFDGSFGLQLGVGVQFTKNVGLDLTYTAMNFKFAENIDGVEAKAEIELSGLEVGLTATF